MRTIRDRQARSLLIGALVASISVCVTAYAQTWKYEASINHEAVGPVVPGELTLEQVAGRYQLRMAQYSSDACYRSPMNASVERTPSTITITATPVVAGCTQNRFVLNTDGTVGTREFLQGGQWRRDDAFRLRK